MHNRLELHGTGFDVIVSQTSDGNDWEARIYRLGLQPEFRYFSVLHSRIDGGLLEVSQKLRREFGITGTYKPA